MNATLCKFKDGQITREVVENLIWIEVETNPGEIFRVQIQDNLVYGLHLNVSSVNQDIETIRRTRNAIYVKETAE